MRQLILDTETTGLDPEQGHRIIEFAALEMINRKLTGNYLHLYINPEREIEETASRIHGITNSDVQDKPTFSQVAKEIVEFITGSQLIIHNAKFDVGFMDFQFKQEKLKITNQYVDGIIDTLIIARRKFSGSKNTLDALCDRFKVDRSARKYHGALVDCELLAEVYLNLTREQISLLENNESWVNADNSDKYAINRINDNNRKPMKIITASASELQAHQQYLGQLDNLINGKW